MAETALEQLGLDTVMLIPCGNPPHKSGVSVWDSKHRYQMTKLLTDGKCGLVVSDIEIKSDEKSYTALTLTRLKNENPDMKLFFIVGADSLCYMDKWKNPEIIFEKAEIILIDRIGFSERAVDEYITFFENKYNAVIHKVKMDRVDVSSSFLREEIEKGRDVSEFTGENVYRYILENLNGIKTCI